MIFFLRLSNLVFARSLTHDNPVRTNKDARLHNLLNSGAHAQPNQPNISPITSPPLLPTTGAHAECHGRKTSVVRSLKLRMTALIVPDFFRWPRGLSTSCLFRSLLVLLVACLARAADAEHLRLFILTGQSNALGTTASGEDDLSPGSDPSDQRIQLFWHNVADAETTIGDSGGAFLPLQEQQGGHYPGNRTHWGPEFGFARTAYRAGIRNLGIIKVARGGGGNTNWSKDRHGHMYQAILTSVQQATEVLRTNGHTYEFTGLLYLQGESDSPAEAAQAGTRLQTLVTNLRTSLPHADHLHAVIAGIAAPGTTSDVVRRQHHQLASTASGIDFFSTSDLRTQLYDNLHFDRDAKLEIGRRFASAFFQAGVLTPSYGCLTCIGDSITQGGEGYPSYRYPLFLALLNNRAVWQCVGSQTGGYKHQSGATPPLDGIPFPNIHEGHWGWRAYWINGRLPLPATRISHNRGEGTLLNWTGQSSTFKRDQPNKQVTYQGRRSTPDTAIVMIGSNDLSEGKPDAWQNDQLTADLKTIVQQLQAANEHVTIFIASIPPVGTRHPSATWLNPSITAFNTSLPNATNSWCTGTSVVYAISPPPGFDADTMTHDAIHPNTTGEQLIATTMARSLGLPDVPDSGPLPALQSDCDITFSGREIAASIPSGGGWAELNPGHATATADGQIVRYDHRGQSAPAMLDGSHLPQWRACHTGSWSLEMRCRILSAEQGFAVWAGTGSGRIILVIRDDGTTSLANRFDDLSTNCDGQIHVFRIEYDATKHRYQVWRDGQRLTATAVAPDQTATDSRLLIGDYTAASFGDNFAVEIEQIRLKTLADDSADSR
jgi:lysophospholipase L1-like esterase